MVKEELVLPMLASSHLNDELLTSLSIEFHVKTRLRSLEKLNNALFEYSVSIAEAEILWNRLQDLAYSNFDARKQILQHIQGIFHACSNVSELLYRSYCDCLEKFIRQFEYESEEIFALELKVFKLLFDAQKLFSSPDTVQFWNLLGFWWPRISKTSDFDAYHLPCTLISFNHQYVDEISFLKIFRDLVDILSPSANVVRISNSLSVLNGLVSFCKSQPWLPMSELRKLFSCLCHFCSTYFDYNGTSDTPEIRISQHLHCLTFNLLTSKQHCNFLFNSLATSDARQFLTTKDYLRLQGCLKLLWVFAWGPKALPHLSCFQPSILIAMEKCASESGTSTYVLLEISKSLKYLLVDSKVTLYGPTILSVCRIIGYILSSIQNTNRSRDESRNVALISRDVSSALSPIFDAHLSEYNSHYDHHVIISSLNSLLETYAQLLDTELQNRNVDRAAKLCLPPAAEWKKQFKHFLHEFIFQSVSSQPCTWGTDVKCHAVRSLKLIVKEIRAFSGTSFLSGVLMNIFEKFPWRTTDHRISTVLMDVIFELLTCPELAFEEMPKFIKKVESSLLATLALEQPLELTSDEGRLVTCVVTNLFTCMEVLFDCGLPEYSLPVVNAISTIASQMYDINLQKPALRFLTHLRTDTLKLALRLRCKVITAADTGESTLQLLHVPKDTRFPVETNIFFGWNRLDQSEFKLISLFEAVIKSMSAETDLEILQTVLDNLPEFVTFQQTFIWSAFHERTPRVHPRQIDNGDVSLAFPGINQDINSNTALETMVSRLCQLVDRTNYKNRSHAGLSINQSATVRSKALECLAAFVTYPFERKSRQIMLTLATELGNLKHGVTCLSSLAVCLFECPDASKKMFSAVLTGISKVKSSRALSVPVLEFLFTLSQLTPLQHNFRCEDHELVLDLVLEFVDCRLYSSHCVTLAIYLLGTWITKAKLEYRPRLADFAIRELQSKLTAVDTSAAIGSQSSSNSAGGLGTTNRAQQSSYSQPESREVQSMALQVCNDLFCRYRYSNARSQPRRSPMCEFLVQGGRSRSWVYGNRVVTVTTSGSTSKLLPNGLCEKCHLQVQQHNSQAPPNKIATVAANAKLGVVEREKQRHKSGPNFYGDSANADQPLATGSPAVKSNADTEYCTCWVAGWAEVFIRGVTGDLSYLVRTQNQFSLNPSEPEYPLEKLTPFLNSLKKCSMEAQENPEEYSEDYSESQLDDDARNSFRSNAASPRKSLDPPTSSTGDSSLRKCRSLESILSAVSAGVTQSLATAPAGKEDRPDISRRRGTVMIAPAQGVATTRHRHTSGLPGTRPGVVTGRGEAQVNSRTDPAHVFLHFFPPSVGGVCGIELQGQARGNAGPDSVVVELPESEQVCEELDHFDLYFPFNNHKVGVLYVGPGQGFQRGADNMDADRAELEILRNSSGSERYTNLLRGLGSLVSLSDCKHIKVYSAGLDTSGRDRDGRFTYCWIEELFQVMFHVATLMPVHELHDSMCNRKKSLIGNDHVTIVYDDSNTHATTQRTGAWDATKLLNTQLNFVTIIVRPVDEGRHRVEVRCKEEESGLCSALSHLSAPRSISDASLPVWVRQIALHASIACQAHDAEKRNTRLMLMGNWSKRLELMAKLRNTYGTPSQGNANSHVSAAGPMPFQGGQNQNLFGNTSSNTNPHLQQYQARFNGAN